MVKLLNSRNYEYVEVVVRDIDQPFKLAPDKGLRLMDYLASGGGDTKHVTLVDQAGFQQTVLITDIKRVTPMEAAKPYDEQRYINNLERRR